MNPPQRRVYCHTLGCDKNLVDSEALLGRFQRLGLQIVHDPQQADIWVINTCGFVASARHDSHEAIASLAAAKGHRTLVVTGCLAQEHGKELKARHQGIDVVGGVGEFDRVAEASIEGRSGWLAVSARTSRYEGMSDRPLLTPGHMAFVKLGEGCSRTCTFCRIPLIRGPLRSRSIADIVSEVRILAGRGVQEIQLVSQNTADFGRDTGEDLESLLRALSDIDPLRWIRLLYLYPGLIPAARILRILELPRVVPYLDLPIQHASPRILRGMRRPGDPKRAEGFFRDLRSARPDLVLRTTVLLGFPGEEEDDVELLLDFMSEVEFDHLGTYRFSPESGTPAAAMPDRPTDDETADRESRVLDLQAEISGKRLLRLLGKRFQVVVDTLIDADDLPTGGQAADWTASLLDGKWRREADRERAESHIVQDRRLALGRSFHFGYDLDGMVVLPWSEGMAPGVVCEAVFTGATSWDVWAQADDSSVG
jgi:ribosomal protein S12 methylthiotransferase